LADAIKDMRAMSVLNFASNHLGELVLPGGWTKKRERFDGKRQYVFTHADGTKQIGHPGKPEGIIAITNAIPDMGALTKLILRGNILANEQGGKVLSTMLTINSALTELDVSDNWEGAGAGGPAKFAKELAVGLRDNGALSTLTFSGDYSSSRPVTMKTTMTEADFSGKTLGTSGGMMVAAFLPKCQ
jgi:hypothetical protein